MASPQIEDGYTKLANEVYDALIAYRLSGQEAQVVHCIIRKTYGFNKTCDFISMGQISKATGINRPLVSRILNKLYDKNIIGVTQNDTSVTQNGNTSLNCLYFQKDYEKWKVLHKKITVTQNDNRSVTQLVQRGVTQNDTHKRKSFTKERKKAFIPPTLEEVSLYCKERKNNIDPQQFIDSNTAKGWVIGKNQIPAKDWKAMVRTWEATAKRNNNKPVDAAGRELQYL